MAGSLLPYFIASSWPRPIGSGENGEFRIFISVLSMSG